MSDTEYITGLAYAAGQAGRDWMEFTASDEVQAYVDKHPDFDVDAVERAFNEGRRGYKRRNGYVEVYTTAPAAYDYTGFGTEEVEVCGEYENRTLRKVLIPKHGLSYQEGRYSSGLHPTWDEDPREIARKFRETMERERAEKAAREARAVAAKEWLAGLTDMELDAALDDTDIIFEHGASVTFAREEEKRRKTTREDAAREDELARCLAIVPDGAILVDDGEFFPATRWGPARSRPPCVYYNIKTTVSYRRDADDATVTHTDGIVGSLALVADQIATGKLRVAAADEVPPVAVARRVGFERWKQTKRIEVDGKVMWVGRPLFEDPLVLDANGHLIRSKTTRGVATSIYWNTK